jgi:hypothetical protein
MKKIYIIFLFCIFATASFGECKKDSQVSDSLALKETVYYVSPGNTQSSAQGTRDFPYSSLEQARDAIRESRKKATGKDNRYRVVLLAGNYQLKNSFTLTDKDNGTVNAPIIYEGEKNEKVTLNGGINIPIESCKKIIRNAKGYNSISPEIRDEVYCVDLKEILPKEIKQQDSTEMSGPNSYIAPIELCINGEMMTLARYPNARFAKTGLYVDSITFKFDDERISRWKNEPSPMVLGYLKYGWSFSSNRVSAINVNKKTITLQKKTAYGLGNNRPFYVSNLLSELDTPTEYYIDYKTSILYFMLPQGAELSKSTIELSNPGEGNKSIIEINKAFNITFRNLTFTLGRYGAINMNNSNGITLSDLVIHNMGNFAINATGVNNHFQNLHIMDIGGAGITLTGGDRQSLTSSNNLIENCKIERVGRIQRTYNPAISIAGVGNVIRNCQISDLPHIAILFSGNDNLIEKNEIFHVCYETCDAGAIYTGRDWGSRGNVIKNNYIHDINSTNTEAGGVQAIYLDDCASGISVISNIFCNIDAIGIVIGGGRDNIVTGNIIVNCGLAAVQADRRDGGWINLKKDNNFNLKEKIEKLNYKSEIWSKKYPKLAAIFDNGYEDAKLPYGNEVNNNVFWNNKNNFNEARVGALKYFSISNNAELQKSPFLNNNVKAWKFDSKVLPVLPQGFVPIPIAEIGLLK